MKVQAGSVLKYLNLRIFQSPLGFSVDQNYHITELVNECFPTGKFGKVDTPFSTESKYEKESIATLTLTGNDLNKAEIEYHVKFGHSLGRM